MQSTSARLERTIGFALIRTEHTTSSCPFTVETAEGPRAIVLTEKPFIDPKKEIPRAKLR